MKMMFASHHDWIQLEVSSQAKREIPLWKYFLLIEVQLELGASQKEPSKNKTLGNPTFKIQVPYLSCNNLDE